MPADPAADPPARGCGNVHLYDELGMPLVAVTEHTPAELRLNLGRNLTHGLLDALGRAIVTGRYDDGPFPTEAELAKQHGVSRSVTREAVKMLTAKG